MATVEALQGYTGQISEIAAQVRAAANIQHQVVHGGPTLDVLTEGGLVPSLAKQAVLAQDKVNLALESVAAQLAGAMVYSTVALGLAATVNGAYFSVVSANASEYVTLYRNESGVAAPKKVYPSALIDALTVNRSKGYPLQSKTRAGVTSAESPEWSAFLLDIKVVNARSGEFYQLAWQSNESPYQGNNNFNWIIKKFDADTYSSTGAGEVVLVGLGDVQQQFTRSGGIQTVVIVPKARPEMQFVITVDPTGLPAAGTAINSNSGSGFPAWSWIISPSCYSYASEYKAPQIDTLSINSGKVFPLSSSLARTGALSADYQAFRDLFLDIEVLGAEDGKLYRVAYITCAAVAGAGGVSNTGLSSVGLILEEFDKATYESASVAVRLQNYTTIVGTLKRAGGVQTLTVPTTVKPSVKFKLTVDASKLPADGSAFAAVNTGFPGYSWIIDESRYKQTAGGSGVAGDVQRTGVYYTFDATSKVLTYAYVSGDYAYRVTFRPAAMNALPNLTRIDRAPKVTDLSQAAWVLLSDVETDYLPPMQVGAVNNGDAADRIYTGGAHGSDGGGGGVPTARNALFAVFVDGQLIEKNASGYASGVQCMIVNQLMGYNTISLSRYICEQAFSLDLSGSGIGIHAEVTALEDIVVNVDNGPQAYFGGFNDTQMLPDSQAPTRTALDPAQLSGPKEQYPKAWLLLMKSSNGTMACWVDRSYEAGDGRYVLEGASFIRGGGAGRAKFYNAIVSAFSVPMSAGVSYKWRGGYHFFAETAQSGLDTKAALTVGRRKLVAVTTAGVSRAV